MKNQLPCFLLIMLCVVCIGNVSAQQERIDNPDAGSWLNPHADGGTWNEFHFHRVERTSDVLASNANAIWCRFGKEFYGKEVYGYASNDCGTAQSIVPCPEPGSQYTLAASARLNGTLVSEDPGKVFVEFVNGSGVKTRTVEFDYSGTSYVTKSQVFTVPADAEWCHVWVLKNQATEAGLLVDWVSLKSADVDDTPSVPTGLSASAVGSTMVRLQWNAVAGARGYLIERKYASENNTKWKTVVKTFEGGGQTSFLDAIDTTTEKVLEPGVKYDYRISALGDYGNSGVSSTLSATLAVRSNSPGGTTYYIDASGGDDASAGTSAGAAWQSFIPLDKVNLAAGDSVLLKRGETWNEPMQLHGGGALGSEIVVGSYGVSANRPIINVETKAHAAIRMIDVSNCIVSDLELSNWHPFHRKTRRYALEAGEWQANSVSNLTFNNLFVNGVRSVANRGDGGSASDGNIGAGLRIVGNVRQPTKDVYGLLSDITITECVLGNIEMFGIQLHDVDNAVVSSNTTDRIGFTATLSRRLNNSTVSHNTFQAAGYYETSDDNAHIGFYGGTNVVVEHNLINRTHNVNSGQSMNFDGTEGYIIQYNYMKDSDAGSFVVNRTYGRDNVFRYNVSEGIRGQQWFRNLGNRNLSIYNNTVWLEPGQDIQFIWNTSAEGVSDPSTNVWCHNNIFYSGGGTVTADLIDNTAGTVNINISNNVYYGTFTDTPSEDGNPLYADPVLAGPLGLGDVDGYRVVFGAPYITNGLPIAGNGGRDYWGNVLPAGAPTLGAHEYSTDAAIDSDDDKMPDLWEAGHGLNPGSAADAMVHSDSDQLVNLAEFALGGDPTNGSDVGYLPIFGNSGSGLEYVYAQRVDAPSLAYSLELTDDLVSNFWSNSGYVVTGTNVTGGTFDFVTNMIDSTASQKFVRLRIE